MKGKSQIRFALIGLTIIVSAPLPAQTTSTERVFNVDQSIFYALRNRKDILLAGQDMEMAKERIKEAESFNYPKIDMTFNYANVQTDRFMVLPPAFGSILLPRNSPGTYYTTRFSLWQNVYAGGLYRSNIQFAKSNFVRAENQTKVVTNDIVFEVKKAFYDLLASRDSAAVYESVISTADFLSKTVKPGTVEEELQITRLTQEINDGYQALKTRIEKQKLDFLNTLGIELDTEFRIEGTLETTTKDYEISKLLAWAFQYRPEPKQVQAQEEIDALTVKLFQTARYPTVALGAHYEFPGETFTYDTKNWNATISLNLPIYDGWASWSKIRQKRIQVEQNKLKKKELEDSIRLEVRKSLFDYNFWTQETIAAKQNLQKATEYLQRLPGVNLAQSMTILRFYLDAKLKYTNAVLEHLKVTAAVERAVGKSLAKE